MGNAVISEPVEGPGYTKPELADVAAGYVPDTVLKRPDDATGTDPDG